MNPTSGERMSCYTSASDGDLHWNILSGFSLNKRLSITDKKNTFSIYRNDSFSKTSLTLCTFVFFLTRYSRVKCMVLLRSGFQVVGGENSGRQDLGTIISSITPGGPADINSCLKPGMKVKRSGAFTLDSLLVCSSLNFPVESIIC